MVYLIKENVTKVDDIHSNKKKLKLHNMRSGLAPIRTTKCGTFLTSSGSVNQGAMRPGNSNACSGGCTGQSNGTGGGCSV